jgi:hypothetical protein
MPEQRLLVGPADTHAHVKQPSPSIGLDSAGRMVIRSDRAWRKLWSQLQGDLDSSKYSTPSVDFHREVLVIAAEGTFSGDISSVHIDSILQRGADLEVVVRSVRPWGIACMGGQMLTAPVDIVRVPKHSGKVLFVERRSRYPFCRE